MWEALAMADDRKPKEQEGLPEGWKWVRLGEILKYEQPQKYIVISDEYDEKSGIPVLTAGKTFILGYVDENKGICNDLPVILFDDFTTDSRFIDFPFKVKSSATKILRARDESIDLFYVYNALQLISLKPGGDHKRFWISEYSKMPIPLPPLPEQRKIAQILETVDNAIEKTEKIIEKYKRIKQGLMQDLLTKGIDEKGNIRSEKTHKFKDSPLGRIPEEWEVVRLGEVGEIIYGERLNEYEYVEDGSSIVYGTTGIIARTEKYIDVGEAIILPRKGSINNKFYVKEGQKFFVIDTAFYVKFVKTEVYVKYIYYFLHQVNFELLNEATGVPSLNRENLKNILIPLPPLPEQKRIAEILSQIDQTIEKEEKYKEKLEMLKKGLMEDLLTGKVRVNKLLEGESHGMA
jgi:type I restriction enzyme S subunit